MVKYQKMSMKQEVIRYLMRCEQIRREVIDRFLPRNNNDNWNLRKSIPHPGILTHRSFQNIRDMKRARPSLSRQDATVGRKKRKVTTKAKSRQFTLPQLLAARSIEKKYFETDIGDTNNASAGVIIPSLNLVIQGVTDNERVGNKIMITNINMRGFAKNRDLGTGVYAGANLRIILWLDKQCNGASPIVTDILKQPTITSFRNLDNVNRFDILYDHTIKVPCDSTNALHTDESATYWNIQRKGNWELHYSGATGSITELKSNNIGLLYITDVITCLSCAAGICRIKFTDL